VVYLAQRPEDGEVLDMGEILVMLEGALKIVGEASPEPPRPGVEAVEAAS